MYARNIADQVAETPTGQWTLKRLLPTASTACLENSGHTFQANQFILSPFIDNRCNTFSVDDMLRCAAIELALHVCVNGQHRTHSGL